MAYIRVVTHVEDMLVHVDNNGIPSGITIDILNDIQLNSGIIFNVTNLMRYNNTAFSSDSPDFFERDVGDEILSNKADLAASHYYFLFHRAKSLSLLLPIVSESFRVFFVQPRATDGYGIYFAPFGTKITILYYSTIISLMIASAIILWKSKPCRFVNGSFCEAFQNGVWATISAYALKSFPLPISSFAVKILLMTSSLIFWLFSSIYSAFLLSVLSSSLDPIHSFMDLVARDYSIYVNPSLGSSLSGNEHYKTHSSPIYGSLESFKRVLEGGHAHVGQAESFRKYAQNLGLQPTDLCKKIVLVPFISGVSSGFYVSPGFNKTLKELLNRRIARMGDAGMLHHYKSKYFKDSLTSCPRRSTDYLELGMLHVGKLFEVFGVFVVVAFVVLGVELVMLCVAMHNEKIIS